MPATDFKDFRFRNDGLAESQPNSVHINVDANVSIDLVPQMYLGLFASASVASAEAEFYLKLEARLRARARLQFRTAIGTSLRPLPPLENNTCSALLVGCADQCLSYHDTQVDIFLELLFNAAYKAYA